MAMMFAMQNLGPESSGLGYDGTVKFEAKNIFEADEISSLSRTFNFKILESGVSKEDALDLGDLRNMVSITGGGTSAYYWFGQGLFYHVNGDAAQSGLCGKGDTSYMSALWKGGNGNGVPCRIRFKWLLVGDSEDSLTFYAERGPFANGRRLLAECPKRQANLLQGQVFAQSPDFIIGTNGYRRTFKAETVTWEFKRGYSDLELVKTHSGFVDEVEIQPLRKVFFYSHGGSLVDFIWVEPGERFDKWMPLPAAPKRSPRNACGEPDAYAFAGWYDDCEIVWDDEYSGPRSSGSGTQITDSSIVPEGTGTILLHPKWVLVKPNTCYGGGGGTGGGGTGGGDVGCSGNCEDGVSVCVALLNANGGLVSPDRRIVVAGQSIGYLPDAEWEGHVFDGWFTAAVGGSKVSESAIVNADMTLYAHWSQEVEEQDDSCQVTFNANGGTGTMSAQSFTPGVAQNLTANAFTRPDYTFKGWATSAGGSVVYADGQRITISDDITLFAVWSENIKRFTVTFNANGGSGSMTVQTFKQGEKKALKANAFTRTGYTFDGWATSSRGRVVYTDKESIEPTADVTLYAHWTQEASADLQIKSVTFCRTSVYIGENFHGRFKVGNTGEAAAGSFHTEIADGNSAYCTQISCGGVLAGAEQDCRFSINSSSLGVGSHMITVTADSYNDVAETSESNNSKTIYLTVLDVPQSSTTVDWQFKAKSGNPAAVFLSKASSPKVATTTFKKGEAIYAQVNFWNAMKKDTSGEVCAAILLDTGANSYWYWNSGLSGGTIAYVTDSYREMSVLQNLPPGTYTLEVLLDGARFLGGTYVWYEGSKLNNTAVIEFTVTPDYRTVTFNANGGVVSPTSLKVENGSVVGELPTPSRSGSTFAGWFTAASGGSKVSSTTPVTADVTYYAHWTKNIDSEPKPEKMQELHGEVDGAAPTTTASVYDGYLYNEADGSLAGTIQMKIGAPNKKTGLATASATVLIGTAKKKTLKAADKGKIVVAADGPTEIEFTGGEACTVVIGSEGMSGNYGAYLIDGSRNLFSSKDKAETNAAAEAIKPWIGSLAVMWDDGTASVTIDKKGKAKTSVTLSNGKKGTATSQMLLGEEWDCVPVMVTKLNVSFAIWLPAAGGTPLVVGLGDDVMVGKAGALNDGASFVVDVDDVLWSKVSATAMTEYLPNGVPVSVKGSKWTLPKAGKLTLKKDELDDSKAGENPSGLKLTPKRDGTFSGSFKVYYIEKNKLKSKTANVTGLVVNGTGRGTATINKVGSVPIRIE